MKKTIGICLFTLILAGCAFGSVFIQKSMDARQSDEANMIEVTETSTEVAEDEVAESMQIQENYRYLLVEKEGFLVVYEQDGKTVLLETNIRLHGLDEDTRKLLQEGIWITDEKELYDFLESYSS